MTTTANTNGSDRDRRRHGMRALRGLFVSALAFGLLLGYCIHRWQQSELFPLRPINYQADWIQPAGEPAYAGSFRYQVQIPSTVVNAWVMISACDGYELIVNNDTVSRQHIWRPTRPFQNGMSEKGQRLTEKIPAIGLNFPREYQWSGFEAHRVPVFVDIRPELHVGKNVICVQVESRTAPARMVLEGQILLASGERIDLASSELWTAETVPTDRQAVPWTDEAYDDAKWRPAVVATTPPGKCWRSFDPQLFQTPFHAHWMRHPHAVSGESVVFACDWRVRKQAEEAWLRLATNRYFDLFVNGVRVRPGCSNAPDLDSGQWIVERHRALDPQSRPTILAPEELGSPFVGTAFESPPSGDPTTFDFRAFANSADELRSRADKFQRSFTRNIGTVRGREQSPTGHSYPWTFPQAVRPQSHHHDRQCGGFFAYDVSQLVREGSNRVEVRLAESEVTDSSNWSPQLAIDGLAIAGNQRIPMPDAVVWSVVKSLGEWRTRLPVLAGKTCDASALPRLKYRCAASSDTHIVRNVTRSQWITSSIVIVLTSVFLLGGVVVCRWDPAKAIDLTRLLFCSFTAASIALLAALMVRCSFAERYESLWFRHPQTWRLVIAAAILFGLSFACADWLCRCRPKITGRRDLSLKLLPTTAVWPMVVLAVLTIAFCVRSYRLDFQPLDDDEYASTQAILAIAETGAPKFAADQVWYTRSPLFHYAVGGCVAIFGDNIWALRLPSVLFGVATCLLTYLFGSRLLKSPWVGLGAMILLAIHPFEIFTSHVARFYQMQQFFALLTLYFFCKGFVVGQLSCFRYLTILTFLGTVLTQESSCILGFSLLIGFLLFAEERGLASNLKLVLASLCALAVILLDYAVFQSRCMTRLAGISPNLEASISLHFWHPYNLFALFVCYSRLHVVASCFLLLGLPLVCRERKRNALALYVILGSGIVMTNLFVTHISLRYQYWLIPVWALLSMEGMRALVRRMCSYGLDLRREPDRHRRLVVAATLVLFFACLCSMSPWRIAGSHHAKLLGDSTGAMRFIGCHALPEDKIMVTEPHPHAALIESGRVDYDLSVPLLYDFAVMQDGELIDRNGGAKVIGSLPQLLDVVQRHDRMWIAINREKLRNRSKNIRWEYPGARVDMFLRQNCELAYQTYLWSVFLWDAQNGHFESFRHDRL